MLCVSYLVVFDWVHVLMKVGGQHKRIKYMRSFFLFMPVVFWLVATTCSIGQGVSNDMSKWNAAKLIVYMVTLGCISIIQTISGLMVFQVLRQNEATWKSKSSQSPRLAVSTPRTTMADKKVQNMQSPRSSKGPISQKRSSQVYRILKLMTIVTIIEIIGRSSHASAFFFHV